MLRDFWHWLTDWPDAQGDELPRSAMSAAFILATIILLVAAMSGPG
jgi:hypothetical protein